MNRRGFIIPIMSLIQNQKENYIKIMNKRLFVNVIGLTLVVMTFTMCKSQSVSVPSTPEEALAKLIAGNERYINEKSIHPHGNIDRVEETSRILYSIRKWPGLHNPTLLC